jgi:hypothetical protein
LSDEADEGADLELPEATEISPTVLELQPEGLQADFQRMTMALTEVIRSLDKLQENVPNRIAAESNDKLSVAFWLLRDTAQTIVQEAQGVAPADFSLQADQLTQQYQVSVKNFQEDLSRFIEAARPELAGKKVIYGEPEVNFASEEAKEDYYWSMVASSIRGFLHDDLYCGLTGYKAGIPTD